MALNTYPKTAPKLEEGGYFFTEELTYDAPLVIGELELGRPFSGPIWWNSLYWTNFPPLRLFGIDEDETQDGDAKSTLSYIRANGKLSEQYITKAAAREDLCKYAVLPKKTRNFTVECMQYEGVKDLKWRFPLSEYIPLRDNHKREDDEARRFWDNGVIHMGLNATEFSEKVMPVENLDAVIHINDYVGNPMWGYYKVLLRLGGWPYEITKLGTFEGVAESQPEKGIVPHKQLDIGFQYFDEQHLWQLLEGGPTLQPTGPNGEMEFTGNSRRGYKFWAQIRELDWLGPKNDDAKLIDPEVPPEKGYIWFVVEDTIVVPSTGQKGIRVRILNEGIVPCWMDLPQMQVWAGDIPLGYFNEMHADESTLSHITMSRVVENGNNPRGTRKVTFENINGSITVGDPMDMDPDSRNSWIFDKCTDARATLVDLGWMIRDMMYKGCTLKCGPRPGKWVVS
eukprot:gnl/TRDRNA2_/TRDRNA2_179230_c0_seq1.p1 gnl/TRDRNA2_/TRDRNA2_179230_c0~~gnl/TRDRNA2_/TRDRNA2_179230_c0_seq1.p1  ORF type:complete len:453 (+),score=111.52 gnl/TRDRNA2_/TRDRNA2_179230_c0_seq1:76-1434(+)